MERGMSKVVITGVSGYIGSWVAKHFLESGDYQVRGTVRDPTNKEKLKPLKDGIGEKFDEMELVAADLLDADAIDKAIEGMDYVIHVASPILMEEPKDENEVLGPAVSGTENVMKACFTHNVKRVVITSSCLTILDWEKDNEECDESQWCEITGTTPLYDKSKILAEKKAWEMHKEQQGKSDLELVTICPALVLGKALFKSSFASAGLLAGLMTGKIPKCPQVYVPVADIQDVARAHVLALKAPANERYAITGGTYKLIEVGKILSGEFKKYGYKCADKELPTCLAKFLVCCCGMKPIKRFLRLWNKRRHVKNDKSLTKLGMKQYIPLKTSVVEMGWSLIELEMIPDKTKGKSK